MGRYQGHSSMANSLPSVNPDAWRVDPIKSYLVIHGGDVTGRSCIGAYDVRDRVRVLDDDGGGDKTVLPLKQRHVTVALGILSDRSPHKFVRWYEWLSHMLPVPAVEEFFHDAVVYASAERRASKRVRNMKKRVRKGKKLQAKTEAPQRGDGFTMDTSFIGRESVRSAARMSLY